MKLIKSIHLIFASLFIHNTQLYSQSVFMHEAQEDAENSEPLTLWGIISFIVILLIIYVIYHLIKGIYNIQKIKHLTERDKEIKSRIEIKDNGGFVCPICGKKIMDNKHDVMFRIIEGKGITFKLCKSCRGRYDRYKDELRDYNKRRRKELPSWVGCILMIVPVGTGIYAMILSFIDGNVFIGFVNLIIVTIVVAGFMGIILKIFEILISSIKPSEPFNMPSISHLEECNAIRKDN